MEVGGTPGAELTFPCRWPLKFFVTNDSKTHFFSWARGGGNLLTSVPLCQFLTLGRARFNGGIVMGESDVEMQKPDREHALRAHDSNREELQNANAAAIEAGNIAIRSLLLINGGASVALLAFVGAVESGNSDVNSEALV